MCTQILLLHASMNYSIDDERPRLGLGLWRQTAGSERLAGGGERCVGERLGGLRGSTGERSAAAWPRDARASCTHHQSRRRRARGCAALERRSGPSHSLEYDLHVQIQEL